MPSSAKRSATTFATRLETFKGIGPGFDQLRVVLSLSVLFWHSFVISYGQEWALSFWASPFSALLAALLPMFFGLSGFLVMGSALRVQSLTVFVLFRTLRIAPALITEVTLSALIVGPVLTRLPIGEYFRSPMLFEYFTSLLGWIHFRLPGLFIANPVPEVVNSSLWTVGPEILCYITLSGFIVTGLYKRPTILASVVLVYVGFCIAADQLPQTTFLDNRVPTRLLVMCFLMGNLLYVFKDRVPFSGRFTIASGIIGIVSLQYASEANINIITYPALLLIVYFINGLGLTRLPRIPFTRHGDYSYGIYIFGFPVQQAITMVQPAPNPLVNFALALPVTLGLAVLSWHYVEKPVLNLRKRFAGPRATATPVAVQGWPAYQGAICLALAVYGSFVITANDIFPIREFAKQTIYARLRR